MNNDPILKLPEIRCNLNDKIELDSDVESLESGHDEDENINARKEKRDKLDDRNTKAKARLESYKSSKF